MLFLVASRRHVPSSLRVITVSKSTGYARASSKVFANFEALGSRRLTQLSVLTLPSPLPDTIRYRAVIGGGLSSQKGPASPKLASLPPAIRDQLRCLGLERSGRAEPVATIPSPSFSPPFAAPLHLYLNNQHALCLAPRGPHTSIALLTVFTAVLFLLS